MSLVHNNRGQKNHMRLEPLLLLYAVLLSIHLLPTQIYPGFIVCLALIFLIFGNKSGLKSYIKITWPLICIFVIGMAGFYGHEERHIERDIAYTLYPIALIYLGNWLAWGHIDLKALMKSMIFFGILLALIHLSKFVLNPELIDADLTTLYIESYVSGDLVVLALVLGLFQNRLGLGNLFPRLLPRYLSLVFLFLSFVLSYSRTEFVILFMLSLALLGYLHRVNTRFIMVVALLTTILFIITNIGVDDDDDINFFGKILRSLTEVTISDYEYYEDIANNWRGFETYRTIETYKSGSDLQKIFGQGFGSLVFLNMTMNLAGSDYEYIPAVHNGYAYILIKTGLIGVLLYLTFYLKIIHIAVRNSNTNNTIKKNLALLLLGIVLSLILTMYVVGGPAELHGAEFLLLIGYLTRRLLTERIIVM